MILKLIGALMLTLISCRLYAQRTAYIVVDAATKVPIANASIKYTSGMTFTDSRGGFSISSNHPGDTAVVTHVGYKTYHFNLSNRTSTDTTVIYLQQLSVMLKDVNIKAARNFKADSIRIRKEFSSVFNHKGTSIKDLFIANGNSVYVPYNYVTAPNNTTQIVTVNVLSVISMLSKNKSNVSRLQKSLTRDEEENYVDYKFSKQKIETITALRNDSLNLFMDKYRPSVKDAKKMTDYEMMIYIKKCYTAFVSK